MLLATLIFSGWNWIGFATIAIGLAIGFSLWSYRATPSALLGWSCFLLKVIGFALLAVCLLEPLWSGRRVKPGANLFAIVADNSQGLQIKDRGMKRSRGETLRELLNPQLASWQATLQDDFEVRRYFFDTRLQNATDFTQLAFDGRASALGSALRTLSERYRGRPLAGVLLLTDGNATDLRGEPDLDGLPPIYPVVIGSSDIIKDLALQQARVSQSAFEDAPVAIEANVAASGFQGKSVVAQLFDLNGKKVAQETLRVGKDKDTLAFHFQLKPEKSGVCFYRLWLRASDELGPSESLDKTEEATLANNQTVLVVDRGRGPYRLLYVAGRPNWEFKFLNRALQEDEQLQLVGLIRIARREPKFTFMGRPGETSNPLFRGFGNQSPEEVERYDRPVLIRLNTRDELELRAGFPSSAEELYAYHGVIVDDLEAEFFTPDQAALLQRYVSERGGGLLMLGGMESFQQGNYQRTPIGDMLPVYLDRFTDAWPTGAVHLSLTPEGWLQPWARLRENEVAEKARLQSMAPFFVLNAVHEVKPGASVIATVADGSGKSWPALVTQRFGRGRTAALTIGDLWHWGLHDAEAHHDMDKAWRQLIRWLVTDVPDRVELTIPQSTDANGAVELQVRVRDPKFQPLDNAGVTLDIQPVLAETNGTAGSKGVRLQAEASVIEPGLYLVNYMPRLTAGYKATAFVTNSVGAEVGRAEAGWTTDLAAEEFRSLTPNFSLLENIARKSGGQIIQANRLEEFARNLPHRHAPIMEAWTFPLWHTPAMFGFALACFLAEWGLRRWKGLP